MTPAIDSAAADWQLRWEQLVRAVARVHSRLGEEQLIDWISHPAEPLVLAFVNAHAMNSVAQDAHFFQSLMSADVVLRDGIGMAILLQLLNQPPGLNMNGTDLIPRIIERFSGQGIALFGTREPYLLAAQAVVEGRLAPGSRCIVANGFQQPETYVRLAAAHKPSLVVLGMGMPRQETVALMLRAAVGYPCLIVCGGAIIDFLGNKTSRAPAWLRRGGFEWLFRLALEPRRLFRRYVLGNPLFLARAVLLAARSLRVGQGTAV
ncbi:MAG TPA: WecB/TagA/CpsF family glycosyltransferase [Ramlibacter sp.]|nr:WecB/TagA/CpsF family glycosyltransferase [Ramlibacter sp.]